MHNLYHQSELKSAKLRAVLDTEEELCDREDRSQGLEEENTKLKKELDKLKRGRDQVAKLKASNIALQDQLKELKKAHQG